MRYFFSSSGQNHHENNYKRKTHTAIDTFIKARTRKHTRKSKQNDKEITKFNLT
jgi:hypothetical protein